MLATAARITKNMAALLFSKGISLLISFSFTIYVARYLGVSGFGKYSLVSRYFDLFLSLAATGLTIVLTREIAQDKNRTNRWMSVAIFFVFILAVFAGIALFAFGFVFDYSPDTRLCIGIACFALLPGAVSLTNESAFVAYEKAEYVTYTVMSENIVRVGLSYLALRLGYGLETLFVILVVVRYAVAIWSLTLLSRLVKGLRWDFAWDTFRDLFKQWRVFAGENWLSNIFNNLDVMFISWFFGEAAVGLYSAAYKLLSLGGAVFLSVNTAIYPHISRLYKESRTKFFKFSEEMLKYILAAALPLVFLMIVFSDRLLVWLYSDAYSGSTIILQILLGLLLMRSLNTPMSYLLFSQRKQMGSLIVVAISLIIYIPIGLWLTVTYGSAGTAGAYLFSTVIGFAIYLALAFEDYSISKVLISLGKIFLTGLAIGLSVLIARPVPLIISLPVALILYGLVLWRFQLIALDVFGTLGHETINYLGTRRHRTI